MFAKEFGMKNASNNKKYYIGVDVGGSSIKFGIFKMTKAIKLTDTFSIPTVIRKKDNERLLLNDIFTAIDSYFRNSGLAELAHTSAKDSADVGANYVSAKKDVQLAGIGFSVPGPVVNNKLIHAVNINWKKKCDIVKATKKRFGKNIKVTVMNDANAAALAEYKLTLKEKCNSMCLITLGTGVGTGIIVNGKLVEGKTGIAGEIAHIRVDYSKDARKCSCGNVGCLETIVGSRGIVNTYMSMKADGIRPYKTDGILVSVGDDNILPYKEADDIRSCIKEIIYKAKAGDKTAIVTLDLTFDYLSQLIAILVHVIEPEVVLIGGGISNAGEYIIKTINKHLRKKVFMTKEMPKVKIAKLKNSAGIYGAVLNV